jgi:signal transduction histidine kinase
VPDSYFCAEGYAFRIRCSAEYVRIEPSSLHHVVKRMSRPWLPCIPSNLTPGESMLRTAVQTLEVSSMESLQRALSQARTVSSHTERMREEERHRIGQEIHDNLGGILTYLKLDLTRLRNALVRADSSSRPQLKKRIDAMVDAANSAIATVQRVGMELRPVVLEHYGLTAAIDWQAAEFERRTGIRCGMKRNLEVERFEMDRELLVFRVVQEALANVARHARATEVSIGLMSQEGQIVLTIEDDGVGISRQALSHPKSMGLIAMKERARLAGGELSICPRNGNGTVLTITIPTKCRID